MVEVVRVPLDNGDYVFVEHSDEAPNNGEGEAPASHEVPQDVFSGVRPILEAVAQNLNGLRGTSGQLTTQFGIKVTPEGDTVVSKDTATGTFVITARWSPQ